MDAELTRRPLEAAIYQEAFERFSLAVVVLDGAGGILAYNDRAADLFGAAVDDPAARCCDLVGCAREPRSHTLSRDCITAAVLAHGRPLKGLVGVAGGRRIELAATPLAVGAMLQIRPMSDDASPLHDAPPLRITTLGSVALECGGVPLGGPWVNHRPGEVLRHLICLRGHRVAVGELVDAIWPEPGRGGVASLRQSVHSLRERLEPDRPSQARSRFVVASPGAYALDMDHVVIDADEFEAEALAALVAVKHGRGRAGDAQLERAAELYTGEFLADDHYGDRAVVERDRLRSLAAQVLRELADLNQSAGRLPATARALERLVELEPLDLTNQRDLISFLLRTGHHASAARRYDGLRRQFKRAFGDEPGFTLPDLVSRGATLS